MSKNFEILLEKSLLDDLEEDDDEGLFTEDDSDDGKDDLHEDETP